MKSRFRETFRERMPEWVLAFCMTAWGLATLNAENLFQTSKFFHPLLNIATQTEWGLGALAIGLIRIVFLVINGGWRPSAHIRALGCILGSLLWGNLLFSSLSLDWMTPSVATFASLLFMDLLSLWFAAGDAKLADEAARGKLRI